MGGTSKTNPVCWDRVEIIDGSNPGIYCGPDSDGNYYKSDRNKQVTNSDGIANGDGYTAVSIGSSLPRFTSTTNIIVKFHTTNYGNANSGFMGVLCCNVQVIATDLTSGEINNLMTVSLTSN